MMQSLLTFAQNPVVTTVRDWTADGAIVGGVIYVIKAASRLEQWTKDHAKEDDDRFSEMGKNVSKFQELVGNLEMKMTDQFKELRGVLFSGERRKKE